MEATIPWVALPTGGATAIIAADCAGAVGHTGHHALAFLTLLALPALSAVTSTAIIPALFTVACSSAIVDT
jgi:hypothetical protein